ncbi:MAG TPA: hypothetical protein V6D19_09030 [Stenomitos sp.]
MPLSLPLNRTLSDMPSWTKILAPALTIVLSYGAIVQLQLQRLKQIESKGNQDRSKTEYVLEATQTKASLDLLAKMPDFGFRNLVADWSFLNFLQYFGDDKARAKTGYRVTPNFFQVIVSRDPLFLEVYPYLSASVTLYAGQPQQTVQLLQQAINKVPASKQTDAYFLWQSKGTDELLFLGRTKDAQHSYEMASAWASKSSDPVLQGIAQRSQQTARFIASNPNSKRARVGAWFTILSNAVDDSTRQFAVRQIQSLGGTVKIDNGLLQVKLPKID